MVITIRKDMTRDQVNKLIKDALNINWEQKKSKKSTTVKKLGGLLSRLKLSPLEIQKEMRDGWLE